MYVTDNIDLSLYEARLIHAYAYITDYIYVHRSLWNMGNYIHVMLCSNLLIAQLLFVVGIEQTKYWVCGHVTFM